MLSTMGGMNVEEIAEKDPDALVRRHVDPHEGFAAAEARAARAPTPSSTTTSSTRSRRCWSSSTRLHRHDATLIEVNPLIVTGTATSSRSTPR